MVRADVLIRRIQRLPHACGKVHHAEEEDIGKAEAVAAEPGLSGELGVEPAEILLGQRRSVNPTRRVLSPPDRQPGDGGRMRSLALQMSGTRRRPPEVLEQQDTDGLCLRR